MNHFSAISLLTICIELNTALPVFGSDQQALLRKKTSTICNQQPESDQITKKLQIDEYRRHHKLQKDIERVMICHAGCCCCCFAGVALYIANNLHLFATSKSQQ